MIEYSDAGDVKDATAAIVAALGFAHIDLARIQFVRSRGSKSRSTVARIHGQSRIWRHVLDSQVTYTIEVLSEQYDRLSEEEKEKTLVHELLHIPYAFGGGLLSHRRRVTKRTVEKFHTIYSQSKKPT